ncbi:hypothetical protein DI09_150p40 [Mitosporidium daphniae]|uniref:Uncharacterized protein n=1 Tax=Mitosporidium daphniae TaxID=1485682 RepID=A0A098VUG4_9MICR|nr:uncharacterized protein DI09_150p40 [Mitosporidium daphniae]KGG52617.1 hypothetical protein DI09_150p40 [Mitosporidium daphniae]|eukprot:XP_013239053.1 uncharacterized protein DI09_150p40 [Mitosporidium daphniae]
MGCDEKHHFKMQTWASRQTGRAKWESEGIRGNQSWQNNFYYENILAKLNRIFNVNSEHPNFKQVYPKMGGGNIYKERGETNPYLGAARQQGFQNVVLTQVQKVIQRGVVVFFLYFGGEDGE